MYYDEQCYNTTIITKLEHYHSFKHRSSVYTHNSGITFVSVRRLIETSFSISPKWRFARELIIWIIVSNIQFQCLEFDEILAHPPPPCTT